jgi:hypothetical protein
MVPVSTSAVVWRTLPVLAVAAVPGTGVHDALSPPWPGWRLEEFASHPWWCGVGRSRSVWGLGVAGAA